MEGQDSITLLATKAWLKLSDIDPGNELLKWFESDSISDQDFNNEFWGKEESWKEKPTSMVSRVAEQNYFLALQQELKAKHCIEI